MWKCDDLTPNLCPLDVDIGHVVVRGINVTYWIYSSSSLQDDDNNTMDDPNEDNNDNNNNNNVLPIIILHGGPGFTHNYMLPLKQQACQNRGRKVIFYDQAGCGQSKINTTNKNVNISIDYPWLLTAEYYAHEELPTLINHLNLTRFHIVGNSWGTMLGQLYALDVVASKKKGRKLEQEYQQEYQQSSSSSSSSQQQLVSMVLSGPLSDVQEYIEAQWDEIDGSLGTLPPYVQERIHKIEYDNDYESDEYKSITDILSAFYTLRTYPGPDCFTVSELTQNEQIYVGMQGRSEFTIGGTLVHFNVTGQLSQLRHLPILLTSGKYDTMRPSIVQTMHQQLALSEWVLFNKSGHISMIDEPGLMNDVISNFLNRVEYSMQSNQSFLPIKNTYQSEERASSESTTISSSSLSSSRSYDCPNQFCNIISLMNTMATGITLIIGIILGYLIHWYQVKNNQSNRYERIH